MYTLGTKHLSPEMLSERRLEAVSLWSPPLATDYLQLFERLPGRVPGRPVALVFHGAHVQASPEMRAWLAAHPDFHLINVPPR